MKVLLLFSVHSVFLIKVIWEDLSHLLFFFLALEIAVRDLNIWLEYLKTEYFWGER